MACPWCAEESNPPSAECEECHETREGGGEG